jgi:hypothetical protein
VHELRKAGFGRWLDSYTGGAHDSADDGGNDETAPWVSPDKLDPVNPPPSESDDEADEAGRPAAERLQELEDGLRVFFDKLAMDIDTFTRGELEEEDFADEAAMQTQSSPLRPVARPSTADVLSDDEDVDISSDEEDVDISSDEEDVDISSDEEDVDKMDADSPGDSASYGLPVGRDVAVDGGGEDDNGAVARVRALWLASAQSVVSRVEREDRRKRRR